MDKEIYLFKNDKQYWRGTPHTDSIDYIATTLKEARNTLKIDGIKNLEIIFNEIMSPEDYANTIDANISDVELGTRDIRVIVLIADVE